MRITFDAPVMRNGIQILNGWLDMGWVYFDENTARYFWTQNGAEKFQTELTPAGFMLEHFKVGAYDYLLTGFMGEESPNLPN